MHLRDRVPRLLMVLIGASFFLNVAQGLHRSVFTNFAGQELAVTSVQYGLLEGIREVPGLLTIALMVLVSRMSDERLYTISAALIGAGIWLYASAGSFADLVVATLVQSVGFHLWAVAQDSMVLKSVATGDRARRLGQINSVAAAATLLGMGGVWLGSRSLGLRPFFVIAGVIGLAGAVLSLMNRPDPKAPKRLGFVLRRRYLSYYILTLLQGARRHIVSTFAAFALVRLHGASAQTMAMLLALQSFLAIWTRPMIGRIIDRLGEQRALSLNYGVVASIFVGYAVIPIPLVAYALYVLDNVMTGFDIAVSTHAGRIIPREELSTSLATGSTINHIFGVAVPVVGGLLWEWFGPKVPFFMGAGLVLMAMAYSWNLDARVRSLTPEGEAV